MAIDYATGLLCALVWKRSPKSEDGTFESKASLKGLIRKGAILLVVYIAARLNRMAGITLTRTAVIMFFIANDGFSIIENLGIMGVPLPPQVKAAFALLREKGDAVELTDDRVDRLDGYQPTEKTGDPPHPPSGGSAAQDD